MCIYMYIQNNWKITKFSGEKIYQIIILWLETDSIKLRHIWYKLFSSDFTLNMNSVRSFLEGQLQKKLSLNFTFFLLKACICICGVKMLNKLVFKQDIKIKMLLKLKIMFCKLITTSSTSSMVSALSREFLISGVSFSPIFLLTDSARSLIDLQIKWYWELLTSSYQVVPWNNSVYFQNFPIIHNCCDFCRWFVLTLNIHCF